MFSAPTPPVFPQLKSGNYLQTRLTSHLCRSFHDPPLSKFTSEGMPHSCQTKPTRWKADLFPPSRRQTGKALCVTALAHIITARKQTCTGPRALLYDGVERLGGRREFWNLCKKCKTVFKQFSVGTLDASQLGSTYINDFGPLMSFFFFFA